MGPDEQSSAEMRAKKIAAMQALIDEGRAGGISPYTVKEIFERAREEARRRGFLPDRAE